MTALSDRPDVGSFFCEHGDTDVFFLDFPTQADQDSFYTSYRDNNGAVDQTWTDSSGVERGRFLEFFDASGAAVIYLTFEQEIMAVWAQRPDGDAGALYDWFLNVDLTTTR